MHRPSEDHKRLLQLKMHDMPGPAADFWVKLRRNRLVSGLTITGKSSWIWSHKVPNMVISLANIMILRAILDTFNVIVVAREHMMQILLSINSFELSYFCYLFCTP